MRALVTGGAGFIGSHLVERLIADGHDVTILDNLSTGRRSFVAAGARLIEGDIRDSAVVKNAMAGCQVVWHLAAIVGVRRVVADPLACIQVNAGGTETVLAAAHAAGARVVVASSSEVYGLSEALPFREDGLRVVGPTTVSRWSYATAKALDEHLLFAYREHGLAGTVVRFFNTYGPRQDAIGYAGVVATFANAAVRGEPIVVYGDGSQTRCFCYVDDTVEATYRAGMLPAAEGVVLNVGDDREMTILDLANRVVRLAEREVPIRFVPYHEVFGAAFQDPPRRRPDVTAALNILGFTAATLLDDGIRRTLSWAREECAEECADGGPSHD